MHLSGIDLNLLVVLDALLLTRSVKDAGKRVGLSPSATSHALSRLRALFDDDLLVRAGREMVLTARGEALTPAVRRALHGVEGVFSEVMPVEPATLERRFTVVTTDYGEIVAVQPLGRQLAVDAPGVDLFCRRGVHGIMDELRTGVSDLAIGVFREAPADVVKVRLFGEQFQCLLRRGHPALQDGSLTLDAYCELSHVLVATGGDGRGIVDRVLETIGRSRRVSRTVQSFLAGPHAVVRTDSVLTLPARVARLYAGLLDLQVVEPPLDLPGFEVSMLWHQRSEADRAHAWLRERVLGLGFGGEASGGQQP